MKDQRKSPDAERIRELLEKAAPRDTDGIGRANAVTRRARRSRTRKGVAGGVAVGAFAAAVIVGPHLLKSSPTTNEATDPSNGVVAQATPLDNRCPEQDGLFDGAVDISAIGADATSVRLCKIGLSGVETQDWVPPVDALVDPAAFLASFDGVEAADPARCAAVTPIPDPLYFYVGYADGSFEQAVSTSFCSDVTVAGTPYPVDDVLKRFFNALDDQRGSLTPPGDAAAECPPETDRGWLGRVAAPDTRQGGDVLSDVVSGVVCYTVDPLGGREYADDEGTFTDEDLAIIVDDIGARQTRDPRVDGMCIDTGPIRIVVLVDAWGDRTSWTDSVCTGEFAGNGGYWKPSEQASTVIAAALGGGIDY